MDTVPFSGQTLFAGRIAVPECIPLSIQKEFIGLAHIPGGLTSRSMETFRIHIANQPFEAFFHLTPDPPSLLHGFALGQKQEGFIPFVERARQTVRVSVPDDFRIYKNAVRKEQIGQMTAIGILTLGIVLESNFLMQYQISVKVHRRLAERLAGFSAMLNFRGIDPEIPYPAAVGQNNAVPVVDPIDITPVICMAPRPVARKKQQRAQQSGDSE